MENMNNWQKIAAVYNDAVNMPDLDGSVLELAIVMKLADMLSDDEEVIVAVSGEPEETPVGLKMQLDVVYHDGKSFFLIFADEKNAADMKCGFTKCKLEELLHIAHNMPSIRGLRLIADTNPDYKAMTAYVITEAMIGTALDVNMKKD